MENCCDTFDTNFGEQFFGLMASPQLTKSVNALV